MSTTTTTARGLVDQVRRLLEEADSETVPSGLLAWWGNTNLPDGVDNAPALTQAQWEATYRLIENAALASGVVKPLAAVQAATRDYRPDRPLPIAIASFRAAVPRAEVIRSVRAAAANGSDLRFPPARLGAAIQERRVFAASALLHDQWGTAAPVHRGRDVTFVIDPAFYLTNPSGPWPDRCELDLGDGKGWRPAAFGQQLQAHYDPDRPEIAVRAHYGDEALTARFKVAVSDRPAPPEPDETWPLRAPATATVPSASGRAWVFRAPGRTEILNPVIMVEGFPGGHPCDYMYELLNQAGTVDALHAEGYDLVIVGLDNGLIPIQLNAGVLVACIREARRRTRQPLVVGGVSMGGIISRYALASMESTREPHGTGTYLSIDAPHRGTYTSLGVQWFVHALLPIARSLGGFAALLDSPSNQQLMIEWLHEGNVVQSDLRAALLHDLEAVGGYPRQPRKLAVSCGRGDGIGGAAAGAQTLDWAEPPFLSVALNTLPGDANGVVADGSWFLGEPPALEPLRFPDAPAWETAPGSQNDYNGQVAAVATGYGCGQVHAGQPLTCCVPTVSALDLDQDAFHPIGQPIGPFDAHTCSPRTARHLEITEEVSKWIVEELGAAPMPVGQTPSWNPAGFDPHDPGFLSDPYPTYAQFREHDPVYFVSQYQSHWFFRYADCEAILSGDGTFQKQPPQGPAPAAPTPPASPVAMLGAFPLGLFVADPPQHTVLRCTFDGPFGDQMLKAPAIAAERAGKMLDPLRSSGHMELVADYATPVPANVLFDVLGIPDAPGLRDGLQQWENLMVPSHDITQSPQVRFLGGSARMALLAFMEGLVRQYTATDGGPGMIGAMCKPGATDLSTEALFMSGIDFVVAGYLSTTWLVASAINSLLAHPDQWEALLADPSKRNRALEEVLRFEPPFQLVDRYVAQDTVLGGVALKRGDTVTAVVGSANRDPAKFADPDALDIERDSSAALTFGGGIHYCIGAPLARIMAPAMLAELLSLRELALDGQPQWGSDPYMRAITSLPLSYRPS
jgi:cytochrome P450